MACSISCEKSPIVKLPPLEPSDNHTILFKENFTVDCSPQPSPDVYEDAWDKHHVYMPCSPKNISQGKSKSDLNKPLWQVICSAFSQPVCSSLDLEKTIMSYNAQHKGKWKFPGLHSLFDKYLDLEYKKEFFESTLPGMLKLALQLPELCTKPIPLLRQHTNHSITMTQKQIACLLVHAFFCTYPDHRQLTSDQNRKNRTGDHFDMPSINFIKLFVENKASMGQRYREKLKCLFNYFSRVVKKEPTGTVTFRRQYLERFPDWASSEKAIKFVQIHLDGCIEKEGCGMLQVDFAHKVIGGLVLEHGCVQEEIRFVICPELIISRLFMEQMDDNEAIIITGVEQYSKYKGYANSFLFDGNFEDNTPRDSWGRRQTQIVAMDALDLRKHSEQFQLPLIKRELHKAYVGFLDRSVPVDELTAVATGNWGCGAYRGSLYLKFLIQIMSASEANRNLSYFTFGDEKLCQDLKTMHEFITKQELTVGDLWKALESYSTNFADAADLKHTDLYDHIYSKYG